MTHRVRGQESGTDTRLRRIAEPVDWFGFAALLADLHASGAGRPS
jgi:hypothetical protein